MSDYKYLISEQFNVIDAGHDFEWIDGTTDMGEYTREDTAFGALYTPIKNGVAADNLKVFAGTYTETKANTNKGNLEITSVAGTFSDENTVFTTPRETAGTTSITMNGLTNEGTITMTGAVTFTDTAFVNNGSVTLNEGVSFSGTSVTNTSETFKLNGATLEADTVANSGTITLSDSAVVTADFADSNEVGTIKFLAGSTYTGSTITGTNNVTFAANGNTAVIGITNSTIEANELNSNDKVTITGSAITAAQADINVSGGTFAYFRVAGTSTVDFTKMNGTLTLMNGSELTDSTIGGKIDDNSVTEIKTQSTSVTTTLSGENDLNATITNTGIMNITGSLDSAKIVNKGHKTNTEVGKLYITDAELDVASISSTRGEVVISSTDVDVQTSVTVDSISGDTGAVFTVTDAVLVADSVSFSGTCSFTVGGESSLDIGALSGTIELADGAILTFTDIVGGKVAIDEDSSVTFAGVNTLSTINNAGTITIASNELPLTGIVVGSLTADSVSGAITIDADLLDGIEEAADTYKVVSGLTGTYSVTNEVANYNKIEFNGSAYIAKYFSDNSILYVNDSEEYQLADEGDVLNDGNIKGYNAFSSLVDALTKAQGFAAEDYEDGVTISVTSSEETAQSLLFYNGGTPYVFNTDITIEAAEELALVTIPFTEEGIFLTAGNGTTFTIDDSVTLMTEVAEDVENPDTSCGAIYLNFHNEAGGQGKFVIDGNLISATEIKIFGETEITGSVTAETLLWINAGENGENTSDHVVTVNGGVLAASNIMVSSGTLETIGAGIEAKGLALEGGEILSVRSVWGLNNIGTKTDSGAGTYTFFDSDIAVLGNMPQSLNNVGEIKPGEVRLGAGKVLNLIASDLSVAAGEEASSTGAIINAGTINLGVAELFDATANNNEGGMVGTGSTIEAASLTNSGTINVKASAVLPDDLLGEGPVAPAEPPEGFEAPNTNAPKTVYADSSITLTDDLSNSGTINLTGAVDATDEENPVKYAASLEAGTLTNTGTINANADSAISAGSIGNSGTINATGSQITVTTGSIGNTGKINATDSEITLEADDGTITLNKNSAELNINNSTINASRIDVSKGSVSINGSTVEVGKLDLETGATVTGENNTLIATERTKGTLNLVNASLVNSKLKKGGSGTGQLFIAATYNDGSEDLDNVVTFKGVNRFTGEFGIVNEGTISVDGALTAGEITNSGTISIDAGASISAKSIAGGAIELAAIDTTKAQQTLITTTAGVTSTFSYKASATETITLNEVGVAHTADNRYWFTRTETDITLEVITTDQSELVVDQAWKTYADGTVVTVGTGADAKKYVIGYNAFGSFTGALMIAAELGPTETVVDPVTQEETTVPGKTTISVLSAVSETITNDVYAVVKSNLVVEGSKVTISSDWCDLCLTTTDGHTITLDNEYAFTGTAGMWPSFDKANIPAGKLPTWEIVSGGTVFVNKSITSPEKVGFQGNTVVDDDAVLTGKHFDVRAGAGTVSVTGNSTYTGTNYQIISSGDIILASGTFKITDSNVSGAYLQFNDDNKVTGAASFVLNSDNTKWTLTGPVETHFYKDHPDDEYTATFNFMNGSVFDVTGAINNVVAGENTHESHTYEGHGTPITFNVLSGSTMSAATITNAGVITLGNVFDDNGTPDDETDDIAPSKGTLTAGTIENSGTITAYNDSSLTLGGGSSNDGTINVYGTADKKSTITLTGAFTNDGTYTAGVNVGKFNLTNGEIVGQGWIYNRYQGVMTLVNSDVNVETSCYGGTIKAENSNFTPKSGDKNLNAQNGSITLVATGTGSSSITANNLRIVNAASAIRINTLTDAITENAAINTTKTDGKYATQVNVNAITNAGTFKAAYADITAETVTNSSTFEGANVTLTGATTSTLTNTGIFNIEDSIFSMENVYTNTDGAEFNVSGDSQLTIGYFEQNANSMSASGGLKGKVTVKDGATLTDSHIKNWDDDPATASIEFEGAASATGIKFAGANEIEVAVTNNNTLLVQNGGSTPETASVLMLNSVGAFTNNGTITVGEANKDGAANLVVITALTGGAINVVKGQMTVIGTITNAAITISAAPVVNPTAETAENAPVCVLAGNIASDSITLNVTSAMLASTENVYQFVNGAIADGVTLKVSIDGAEAVAYAENIVIGDSNYILTTKGGIGLWMVQKAPTTVISVSSAYDSTTDGYGISKFDSLITALKGIQTDTYSFVVETGYAPAETELLTADIVKTFGANSETNKATISGNIVLGTKDDTTTDAVEHYNVILKAESGKTLQIDNNIALTGSSIVLNHNGGDAAYTGTAIVNGNLSGYEIQIDGNATVAGTLTAETLLWLRNGRSNTSSTIDKIALTGAVSGKTVLLSSGNITTTAAVSGKSLIVGKLDDGSGVAANIESTGSAWTFSSNMLAYGDAADVLTLNGGSIAFDGVDGSEILIPGVVVPKDTVQIENANFTLNLKNSATMTAQKISNNGSILSDKTATAITAGSIVNGNESQVMPIDLAVITAKTITVGTATTAGSVVNWGVIGQEENVNEPNNVTVNVLTIFGDLENHRLVVANTLTAAGIDNADELITGVINSGEINNTGIISVGNSLTASAKIVNTGTGTIQAGDNGAIEATDALNNTGATSFIQAGTIQVVKSELPASEGSLTNVGKIQAKTSVSAAGTITNSGEITTAAITSGAIQNDGSISASSIDAAGITNNATGTIAVAANGTIGSTADIANKGSITLNAATINAPWIANRTSGSVETTAGSTINASINNEGTFVLAGSALTGGNVYATNATNASFTVSGASTLTITNKFTGTIDLVGATLSGSTVCLNGEGEVVVNGTTATASKFSGINTFGNFSVAKGAALTITAAAENCLVVNGDFTNAGAITIDASSLAIGLGEHKQIISVTGDIENTGSFNAGTYQVIVQNDGAEGTNGVYVYNAGGSFDKSTIVVDGTLGDDIQIGDPVNFGGDEYVFGITAFKTADEIVNLTADTTAIKFKTKTTSYGTLNLARTGVTAETAPISVYVTKTDGTGTGNLAVFDDAFITTDVEFKSQNLVFEDLAISGATVTFAETTVSATAENILITDAFVDFEGATTVTGDVTIIDTNSENPRKKARVNFGEETKTNTTSIGGDLTVTDADVDFDDKTLIGGNVVVNGKSEIEFDRDTTVTGTVMLAEGSVIEADQGYTFTANGGTINGTILATNKDEDDENPEGSTTVSLGSISGTGTIYTDVNSALSFNGTYTGDLIIDVTGLEVGDKTIATRSSSQFHISVIGDNVAEGTSYKKYFKYSKTTGLTKLTDSCNVYVASTDDLVKTATAYTWTGNDGATYRPDNIVVAGTTFQKAKYFSGLVYGDALTTPTDYLVTIESGDFQKISFGGTYVNTEAANTKPISLGEDIDIVINDGLFEQDFYGGDNVKKWGKFERNGDITLEINGGTFTHAFGAGSVFNAKLAEIEKKFPSVSVDSTSVTITGGTFEGMIYGGCSAAEKAVSKFTYIYNDATVTIKAGLSDISINTLTVGSYGYGNIGGKTNLILTGNTAVLDDDDEVIGYTKIEINDIWGGCGGDYYTVDREYISAGMDDNNENRYLTFDGFVGSLDCAKIRAFSNVEVLNGTDATLSEGAFGLADVSNWTFDAGSTLNGAFINDLTGDTLTLNGLDTYEFGQDGWMLFSDTTNFTFGDKLNINGTNYDCDGSTAITFDDNYKLSFDDSKMIVTLELA